MTVIPAGFGQANLLFGGPGLPSGGECTFGMDVATYSGTPADAASDIIANATLNLMTEIGTGITLVGCLVKFGPDATGPSALVGAAVLGSAGAGLLSPNTTWLVHKTTSFGGRAGRGRMFLPGIREADVSDAGVISPTPLTDMQTAMTAFRSQLIADDLEPVLLHSAQSPIVAPSPIISFSVDSRVATQRRRLRR